MAAYGSPEYALTWKHWDMEQGPPICALRASPRRTSDSACSGWPSPAAHEFEIADPERMMERRAEQKALGRNGNGFGLTLGMLSQYLFGTLSGWSTPQASEPDSQERPSREETGRTTEYLGRQVKGLDLNLTGWPSPKKSDGDRGGQAERADGVRSNLVDYVHLSGWATPVAEPANGTPEAFLERKRQAVANGSTMGICLSDLQMQVLAYLAGWTTPNARDHKSESSSAEFEAERWEHPRGKSLSAQVVASPSPGPTACSSSAATERFAGLALNAAMSRWLQAYPASWDRSSPGWKEWELMQSLLAESPATREETAPAGSGDTATPSTLSSPPSLSAP